MEIDSLYDLVESKTMSGLKQFIGEKLLEATNDWPSEVSSVEEFLSNLKRTLRCNEVNIGSIDNWIQSINMSNYLWEIESIAAVSEILKRAETESLEIVLKRYEFI